MFTHRHALIFAAIFLPVVGPQADEPVGSFRFP
jgi:hypothetical protein